MTDVLGAGDRFGNYRYVTTFVAEREMACQTVLQIISFMSRDARATSFETRITNDTLREQI